MIGRDNRKWSRILPDGGTSIKVRTHTGQELHCRLVDESVEGLAVLLKEHPDLVVGQALELVLPTAAYSAVIRNVRRRGLMVRVGIRVVNSEDHQSDALESSR